MNFLNVISKEGLEKVNNKFTDLLVGLVNQLHPILEQSSSLKAFAVILKSSKNLQPLLDDFFLEINNDYIFHQYSERQRNVLGRLLFVNLIEKLLEQLNLVSKKILLVIKNVVLEDVAIPNSKELNGFLHYQVDLINEFLKNFLNSQETLVEYCTSILRETNIPLNLESIAKEHGYDVEEFKKEIVKLDKKEVAERAEKAKQELQSKMSLVTGTLYLVGGVWGCYVGSTWNIVAIPALAAAFDFVLPNLPFTNKKMYFCLSFLIGVGVLGMYAKWSRSQSKPTGHSIFHEDDDPDEEKYDGTYGYCADLRTASVRKREIVRRIVKTENTDVKGKAIELALKMRDQVKRYEQESGRPNLAMNLETIINLGTFALSSRVATILLLWTIEQVLSYVQSEDLININRTI